MTRPAPPEFDIGEVTGTARSFARHLYPQGDYPFVSALHQAYRQHRTLDPARVATVTGIHVMGMGTVLPWVPGESEEFLREVTLTGYELIRLAHGRDENGLKENKIIKHLFLPKT